MSKCIIILGLVFGVFSTSVHKHQCSTKAIVTLVGSTILSQNADNTIVKYKREDCPVCKGKGWYMSGDGIAKIQCQYCEP